MARRAAEVQVAKTKETDPSKLRWTGSAGYRATGRAPALKLPVAINLLHGYGNPPTLGVYYGGTLAHKLPVPQAAHGGYDYEPVYATAKLWAQGQVDGWAMKERKEAEELQARIVAEAAQRLADEQARGVAKVAQEKAEAYARQYLARGDGSGFSETTAAFCRDVLRAFGYPVEE